MKIMKSLLLLSAMFLMGCKNNQESTAIEQETTVTSVDTAIVEKPVKPVALLPKKYANARFKDVGLERISETKFRIFGQAQIFEANFNWVVEDGHEELSKGYQMTDAGAPEWGKFDFTIDVPKKQANSTLTLILFETSAEDGSRQHELPIVLY